MTRLQSAYPEKFCNFIAQTLYHFTQLGTTQSVTLTMNSMNFVLSKLYFTTKFPWQHPKPIMTIFPQKTRNSPERNLFVRISVIPTGLTK